jgi:hypothetical protein
MKKKQATLVLSKEQKDQLAQLENPNHIREKFGKIMRMNASPKSVYRKWEELLRKTYSGEKLTEEDVQKCNEVANAINPMITHRLLMNIPQGWERISDATSIAEFADDIAKEYGCKTTMELSLCEIISASWYAVIRWSQRMQAMYNMEYISDEKSRYYSMISKEIEKQSRLYMNAMMTLRALKTPFGNVSIRAQNAFIWENQQFNDNRSPEVWENL